MTPAVLPSRDRGAPGDGRPERCVHVVQGEFHVSDDPDVVLSTILGSCVAACLHDPGARLGGMNHFLLPGTDGEGDDRSATRYGVHAMELLVNGLLRAGARRDRLEAKLFGGGRMVEGLTDVGMQNAAFAERFLRQERIALAGSSLRGDRGRRVQFWPSNGRTRQKLLGQEERVVFTKERRSSAPVPSGGSVEFF